MRPAQGIHPARDHARGGDPRDDVACDLSLCGHEPHRPADFFGGERGRRALFRFHQSRHRAIARPAERGGGAQWRTVQVQRSAAR